MHHFNHSWEIFGRNISAYNVQPEGNCLHRALSHSIFGTENCFEILKQSLINKFIASPEHYYNVMQRSGILSNEALSDHTNQISAPNAWGTNVELNMLGALARNNILSIDCTNANTVNIQPNYVHRFLENPIECDAIFQRQSLCILHHRLNRTAGCEHFDCCYFY